MNVHDGLLLRMALALGVVALLAASVVGSASAGGYTDASYLTPRGTVGQPYSHRVEWKPGTGCPPYTYAVVGGDFPPGLSLSSDGYLGGVPTKEGRYSFYIRQTDMCGPEGEGNSPFVITIDGLVPAPPPPPPLVVSSGSLPTAEATLPYAATLSATGGSGSRSWSLSGGQLPQGLVLSSDGRVAGTPQVGGSFAFKATVTAGNSSASADFALTVIPGLTVTPASPPTLEVRRSFALALTDVLAVSGGTPPYKFAPVGGFTYGIGLDTAKATLFGSPRRAGSLSLTIRVMDANGAAADTVVALDVLEKLRLAIERLPTPYVGHRYRAVLSSTGGKDVVWRIASGTLPAGLKLDTVTGTIAGTPRRRGVFRFAVAARDSLGTAVSTRLRLTVARR